MAGSSCDDGRPEGRREPDRGWCIGAGQAAEPAVVGPHPVGPGELTHPLYVKRHVPCAGTVRNTPYCLVDRWRTARFLSDRYISVTVALPNAQPGQSPRAGAPPCIDDLGAAVTANAQSVQADRPDLKHRLPRRKLFAASVGNALEWYDWTIFGLFSIYFADQFYPPGNETLAMLNTFVAYALAFFFRPLGGLLLGRLADVKGRRLALLYSITLMAGGSLVIGLLPTFDQVGWFAPLLMIVARIGQGIAVGGEAANSNVYLAELAPPSHRGRYSSFFQISTASAVLLASLTAFFLARGLSSDAMEEYGWRIPFVVGGVLGLLGIWLRRALSETELFEQRKEVAKRVPRPLVTTLRRHPMSVLQIVGIATLSTLCFYTFFAAATPYAVKGRGADPTDVFLVLSIATAIFVALQYPAAALSDRIGRRPVLLFAAAAIALTIVPLSYLVGSDMVGLVIFFTVGLGFYSLITSILPAIMSELFPTEVRALGIGAWYNLTVAAFGGTAPLILTALNAAGLSTLFFWYVALSGVVMFVIMLRLPETRGSELT
ncbi:MFS transporter [Streptomyces sp. NPDC004726]